MKYCRAFVFLFSFTALRLVAAEAPKVSLLRTPNGGIQPQAAVDQQGTVHLIYYKGDAGGGNVFYVHRKPNESEFSKAIQVNSQAGSAIAAGSIRGAQLAVGKNGRVHVAWDGMGKGATPVKTEGKEVTPLLYTRLNDERTAFEPERNIITYAYGLDGGSSVAADPIGNVYVAWHGRAAGSEEGEAGRALFVARSSDDGRTFAPEKPATAKKLGACACCGMRAFADEKGAVYILYRAATDKTERGETLLVAPGPGAEFQIAFAHPWQAPTCPMSSATLAAEKGGAVGAWETGTEVFFAHIDPQTRKVSKPVSPLAGPKRKHPVAISNKHGQTLLVWTEGTAWAKGGSVAWQVFDPGDKQMSEVSRAEGLPAWSLPTAFANPEGTFVVVY
jgi:hypothetical protein